MSAFSKNDIVFRLAHPEELYLLRQQVLRPHQTIEGAKWPRDLDADCFHVGAFAGSHNLCTATFFPEAYPQLPAQNPYRLRGMATDPESRRLQLGRQVLDLGVRELQKRECDLLWCNARQVAFGFYEKAGFSYLGDLFDIPEVGPHKVMWRAIHFA